MNQQMCALCPGLSASVPLSLWNVSLWNQTLGLVGGPTMPSLLSGRTFFQPIVWTPPPLCHPKSLRISHVGQGVDPGPTLLPRGSLVTPFMAKMGPTSLMLPQKVTPLCGSGRGQASVYGDKCIPMRHTHVCWNGDLSQTFCIFASIHCIHAKNSIIGWGYAQG